MCSKNTSNISRQLISTSNMTTEHGYDILPHRVDTDYCRVFVLILDIRRNRTDTDTHSSDEYESIELLPFLANICALDGCGI